MIQNRLVLARFMMLLLHDHWTRITTVCYVVTQDQGSETFLANACRFKVPNHSTCQLHPYFCTSQGQHLVNGNHLAISGTYLVSFLPLICSFIKCALNVMFEIFQLFLKSTNSSDQIKSCMVFSLQFTFKLFRCDIMSTIRVGAGKFWGCKIYYFIIISFQFKANDDRPDPRMPSDCTSSKYDGNDNK